MNPNTPSAIRNLSIAGFQGLNSQIYLIRNDRYFTTEEIVSRITRQAIRVFVAVTGVEGNVISYRLAMTFSWCMALANRLHVDMETQMQKSLVKRIDGVLLLRQFQVMYAGLHMASPLQVEILNLLEAVGYAGDDFDKFMATK